MDSVAVRNVSQLPNDAKRSLENLVGRPLEGHQQVFILAFTPSVEPTDDTRKEAIVGLTKTWDTVEQHMQQQGITQDEFDAAVDEAVKDVRRRHD